MAINKTIDLVGRQVKLEEDLTGSMGKGFFLPVGAQLRI